jgi:hypothetical protein
VTTSILKVLKVNHPKSHHQRRDLRVRKIKARLHLKMKRKKNVKVALAKKEGKIVKIKIFLILMPVKEVSHLKNQVEQLDEQVPLKKGLLNLILLKTTRKPRQKRRKKVAALKNVRQTKQGTEAKL